MARFPWPPRFVRAVAVGGCLLLGGAVSSGCIDDTSEGIESTSQAVKSSDGGHAATPDKPPKPDDPDPYKVASKGSKELRAKMTGLMKKAESYDALSVDDQQHFDALAAACDHREGERIPIDLENLDPELFLGDDATDDSATEVTP